MTTQLSLLDRSWCNINSALLLTHMAGMEFTTDDAHKVLPQPENPNLIGVLFASLRCSGKIERTGYRPSARPEANGRVVAVWRVK